MFFETAWVNHVKYEIAEYTDTMLKLTDNEQGVILCPDCIVKKLNGIFLGGQVNQLGMTPSAGAVKRGGRW